MSLSATREVLRARGLTRERTRAGITSGPRELGRKERPSVCGAHERCRDRNDSGESGRPSRKYIGPRNGVVVDPHDRGGRRRWRPRRAAPRRARHSAARCATPRIPRDVRQ
jgi:hypothetical protein